MKARKQGSWQDYWPNAAKPPHQTVQTGCHSRWKPRLCPWEPRQSLGFRLSLRSTGWNDSWKPKSNPPHGLDRLEAQGEE